MAKTSFAEAAFLADSLVQRELIRRNFYRIDPFASNIALNLWGGGDHYEVEIRNPVTEADAIKHGGAMSPTGISFSKYKTFPREIYAQDDLDLPTSSSRNRPDGTRNQTTERKIAILERMALGFRKMAQIGTSSTVAIGATAATKGVDGFRPGPRFFEADDVHGDSAPVDKLIYFDYDDTADTLAMSLDGTNYGTAVDVSGDLYKGPIFGAESHEWGWVDFDFSDSDGGGDWTTTNAATGVTLTPTAEPEGLYSFVHPTNRYFGNLSQAASGANGDALDDDNMALMVDNLVEASGGDLSRCLILARQSAILRIRAIAADMAGGETVDTFMGMKLNSPMMAYGGVPCLKSPYLPTNTRGSATCSPVIGVVLGNKDGFYGFYDTVASEETVSRAAGFEGGSVIADDTATGLPLPYAYREIGEDKAYEMKTLRCSGDYVFEMSHYDKAFMLDDISS